MKLLTRYACLLLSVAVVVGCQSESTTVPVTEVSAPAPAATAAPAKANSASPRTPDVANPKAAPAQVVEFKPPFPERVDLFSVPASTRSSVRRDEEHGQSVELKGFVNVDEPRAILVIDGVMSPVPEGGEKYGVRVISIQPPNALLQRGRNRWTATLE